MLRMLRHVWSTTGFGKQTATAADSKQTVVGDVVATPEVYAYEVQNKCQKFRSRHSAGHFRGRGTIRTDIIHLTTTLSPKKLNQLIHQ